MGRGDRDEDVLPVGRGGVSAVFMCIPLVCTLSDDIPLASVTI